MTKIIVIGGGVIGCSVARELSAFDAQITVLERGNDVAVGTSKANSGIVHAGFDAKLFPKLSKELDFPYKNNGAMVLNFSEDGNAKLEELLKQGEENGVENLRIISGDEAREMEPEISDKVVSALYAPSSGIVGPYEMTIAYGDKNYDCDAVINCAGVHADEVYNNVSGAEEKIIARKGEYMLLDKSCGYLTYATLFQLPTAMGKGVLVSPTVHGNIIVGPTAEDIPDKDNTVTTQEGLKYAFSQASLSVPALSKRNIITQFTGVRAHSVRNDFTVGESDVPGFYNALGIESPGLSSAPAISKYLAELVAEKFSLEKNRSFNPVRKGIRQFATMTDAEREKIIAENPLYGKVVCRCEVVTEGEIVEAIRRTPGAVDLDGLKRRTRAGMGRCQAGFCTPRLMEILAREKGVDMLEITKKGNGSELLVGRTCKGEEL